MLSPQQFADEWEKISTLLDSRAQGALKRSRKHKGLNERLSNIYIARAREFYAFEHALLTCGRVAQENSMLKMLLVQMHGQIHTLQHELEKYTVPAQDKKLRN